jgi:hypothetical protein
MRLVRGRVRGKSLRTSTRVEHVPALVLVKSSVDLGNDSVGDRVEDEHGISNGANPDSRQRRALAHRPASSGGHDGGRRGQRTASSGGGGGGGGKTEDGRMDDLQVVSCCSAASTCGARARLLWHFNRLAQSGLALVATSAVPVIALYAADSRRGPVSKPIDYSIQLDVVRPGLAIDRSLRVETDFLTWSDVSRALA